MKSASMERLIYLTHALLLEICNEDLYEQLDYGTKVAKHS